MYNDEVAAKQEHLRRDREAVNQCSTPGQGQTAAQVMGNSARNINIPMEYEFRVKLENRRQQLRSELDEVDWAVSRLDNPEVREAIRFYDVLNKCK